MATGALLGWRRRFLAAAMAVLLVAVGCYNTPISTSEYNRGPAPLRGPSPAREGHESCYEDSLTGRQVFDMYCAACHNARSLAERPFSNYRNAAAHMRVRANLTGKEYAELMALLRRWHDVPPPGQQETPAPTRFFFSREINELKQQQPKKAPDLPGGPRPGATGENSPGQPPAGTGPQEGR
jgi:hypothetical protein